MADGDGQENEESEEELDIVYEKSEDCEHVPVNGVFGGIQSRNDFKFNFYVEHYPTPEEEVYELDEDGSAGNLISDEYPADVVRTVQLSAQITHDNTIRIAVFMLSEALGVEPQQIWNAISNQDFMPDDSDDLETEEQ